MAGSSLRGTYVSKLALITRLSHEAILYSLVTFCESLHNLGVPLNWTSHSLYRKRFDFRSFPLGALNLIALSLSLFIQPFIDEPPPELEPRILSRSLNRLCDAGLEITSSTLACSYPLDTAARHYYQVNPSIPFQECHDIMDGM